MQHRADSAAEAVTRRANIVPPATPLFRRRNAPVGGVGLALLVGWACEKTPSPAPPPPVTSAVSLRSTAPVTSAVALHGVASVTSASSARNPSHFFPPGSLMPDNPGVEPLMRDWYATSLARMAEPSFALASSEAAQDTYRLLVLPTWGEPFAVRVVFEPAAPRVVVVVLDGDGGYDPGQVRQRISRALSADERRDVTNALATAQFWTLPNFDPSHRGFDGTQFIVEGRRNGRHHVAHRWMPKPGAFRDLCTLLAVLGGLGAQPSLQLD